MALPRQTRLSARRRVWMLVPALVLAAATAVAGGAVVANQDDEPVSGSRLPIARTGGGKAGRSSSTATQAPKLPDQHVHKCTGTGAKP